MSFTAEGKKEKDHLGMSIKVDQVDPLWPQFALVITACRTARKSQGLTETSMNAAISKSALQKATFVLRPHLKCSLIKE